jgi:hypothetical protein
MPPFAAEEVVYKPALARFPETCGATEVRKNYALIARCRLLGYTDISLI